MSLCELFVPNPYALQCNTLATSKVIYPIYSNNLVSLNGGIINVTTIYITKVNDTLAILMVQPITGTNGSTTTKIYTFDIIPLALRPLNDYYVPVNLISNGYNQAGTLHISPTGAIEWFGAFAAGQVNGFTEVCCVYPLL